MPVIVEKIVEKIIRVPEIVEVERIVEKVVKEIEVITAKETDNHIEVRNVAVDRIV